MKIAFVATIIIVVIAAAVFFTLAFTGWFDPWSDQETTPTSTPTPTWTPSGVGPIAEVQLHLFNLAKGPDAYEYVLKEITYYDWGAEYQEQHGCWEVYTIVGGSTRMAHWYVYGIDTPDPAVYPMPGDPDATDIEHTIIELSAGY